MLIWTEQLYLQWQWNGWQIAKSQYSHCLATAVLWYDSNSSFTTFPEPESNEMQIYGLFQQLVDITRSLSFIIFGCRYHFKKWYYLCSWRLPTWFDVFKNLFKFIVEYFPYRLCQPPTLITSQSANESLSNISKSVSIYHRGCQNKNAK